MKATIAADFESALPEHTDAELAQLEKNVLADPKHIHMPPVIVWSNHKNTIIDGHHQYKCRTKYGLTIKFQKREFDTRQDALREAYSIQLGRRNWSASQRAVAAAELAKLLVKNGTDSTVILQSAAKTAGVSEKTAWDAKKVIEGCPPEIVSEVKAGNFAASDAAANADLPAAKQKKLAKKASEEGTTLKQARAATEPDEKPKKVNADREWGGGDSLPDVQADLKELARRCRELSKFARMILQCEENDPTRPYCSNYSLLTISHPLLHVARCVANDLPVGGTPKKPILYHEEKAASLAK